MRFKIVLLLLAAALVVIAGCGRDHKSKGNATDSAFISDMKVHHQGAIEMAELAQRKAGHPEIESLAGDIIHAQKSEIALMSRLGDDMDAMGMHDSGNMGMSQSQMGMDMDMPVLQTAKPFDKAFIDMMIPHHQGAIAMAKRLLEKGEQPGVRKLAENIISAQSEEIALMRQWRKAWYGSSATGSHSSHHSSDSSMPMGG